MSWLQSVLFGVNPTHYWVPLFICSSIDLWCHVLWGMYGCLSCVPVVQTDLWCHVLWGMYGCLSCVPVVQTDLWCHVLWGMLGVWAVCQLFKQTSGGMSCGVCWVSELCASCSNRQLCAFKMSIPRCGTWTTQLNSRPGETRLGPVGPALLMVLLMLRICLSLAKTREFSGIKRSGTELSTGKNQVQSAFH
jgi:hypothetical protein